MCQLLWALGSCGYSPTGRALPAWLHPHVERILWPTSSNSSLFTDVRPASAEQLFVGLRRSKVVLSGQWLAALLDASEASAPTLPLQVSTAARHSLLALPFSLQAVCSKSRWCCNVLRWSDARGGLKKPVKVTWGVGTSGSIACIYACFGYCCLSPLADRVHVILGSCPVTVQVMCQLVAYVASTSISPPASWTAAVLAALPNTLAAQQQQQHAAAQQQRAAVWLLTLCVGLVDMRVALQPHQAQQLQSAVDMAMPHASATVGHRLQRCVSRLLRASQRQQQQAHQ